ncbi:MAG: TIGR04086 family membrane protein [Clostridia bacterium]|nr:TIGR04086 family membrane protein [Clostridia bacterium]
MKKNGIINGGIIGLVYILLIYLLSSLTGTGFNLNIYSIIMMLICISSGAIGGVVGVNLK